MFNFSFCFYILLVLVDYFKVLIRVANTDQACKYRLINNKLGRSCSCFSSLLVNNSFLLPVLCNITSYLTSRADIMGLIIQISMKR